jgi:protease-4
MKTALKKIINFFLLIIAFIRFLKNTFLNICLLTIFGLSISFIRSQFYSKIPTILNEPGILYVNLNNTLVESYYKFYSENKLLTYKKNLNTIDQNSVFFLVKKIRNAALDPKIKGILLNLQNFKGASQASLKYFGKSLKEFKKTGKIIYAKGKYFTQAQYYLASFADLIFLQKHGNIFFNGISNKKFYYKDFLNYFKIHTYVFKKGQYKSSVDPIIKNHTPKKTKILDYVLINILWKQYLKEIKKNRHISIKKLYSLFTKKNIRLKVLREKPALYAKKNGLVDFVCSKNQINKIIYEKFSKITHNKNYQYISIYDYNSKIINNIDKKKNLIAVIANNGSLLNNINQKNSININRTIQQIIFAKTNKNIKALIFFINSPGGGVIESEKIRKALINFKKSKKPLIILMGGIAASGGYWISTPGDYIIASATTITGSIGVFKTFYTFEKTLKNIGLNYDGVKIPNLSDNINPLNELSSESKKLLQLSIYKNYKKFIKLVSKYRKIKLINIKKIAEGKIWTGKQAKKNGLIDKIGDLDTAIKKSSKLASIKNPEIIFLNNSNKKTIDFSYITNSIYDFFFKRITQNIIKYYFPIFISQELNNFKKYSDIIYIMNNPNRRFVYLLIDNSIQ